VATSRHGLSNQAARDYTPSPKIMNATVTIRRATLADVPAITEIYNEAILTTTATFDLEPKTVAERTQ
jgi:hypothetical protein